MATWKERGEVPDSDDDEDLESLSSESPPQQNNEPRIDELDQHNDANPGHYGSSGDNAPERTTGEEEEEKEEAAEIAEREEFDLPEALQLTLSEGPTSPQKEMGAKSASLDFLRELDFPPSWPKMQDEGEDEDIDILNQSIVATPFSLDDHPHPQDEVSKSYVQIASAGQHLPSSSLESLLISSANVKSVGESSIIPRKRKDALDQGNSDFMPVAKRNFRQRKAIQINPYRIENLDYNQTCRNSGIKPTRIVEVEERRRVSPSVDPDSQVLDSQNLTSDDGFIATEDSQEIEHVSDKPISPVRKRKMPLQSQDLDEVANQLALQDSDEEFPPLEILLKAKVTQQPSTKKRPKTYSTKIKPPPPSKLRTAQISSPQSGRQSSIFDFPTSPLVISSPFPNFDRGPLSRTTSTSSVVPTPGRRKNGIFEESEHISKPTISTVKPLLPPVHVYSDSEMAYPFLDVNEASDSDKAPAVHAGGLDFDEASDLSDASSPSSSNESVEIRRIGRKIRGVLPASHLRLDSKQKKQIALPEIRQASRSLSPLGTILRRGVALPTIRRSTQAAPASTDMAFLEGISDDEEDQEPAKFTQSQRNGLSSTFAQSRVGDAEVEDTIDPMLPSQKRQRVLANGSSKNRRKFGHSGQTQGEKLRRQPKITEHLDNPQDSKPASRNRRPHKMQKVVKPRMPQKAPPPALSILDVTDTLVDRKLPLFIRVAARTVRAKKGHGRQNPTKKVIKLANREDTADARSVLLDWRNGIIQPKNLGGMYRGHEHAVAFRASEIENSNQTLLRSPTKKLKSQQVKVGRHPGVSRKLVISNPVQQSMNEFVLPQDTSTIMHNVPQQPHHKEIQHTRQPKIRQVSTGRLRPAQLESLELELPDQQHLPSFQSSKGSLDRFYRAARKRALLQANLPLSRFITDKDLIQPQGTSANREIGPDVPLQSVEHTKQAVHHRKRQPRRLDIGAAEYRQPNNPLILDFLAPVVVRDEGVSSKLLNLGQYGTNYPISFDIFHLPPGTFFHESTLIGSGRLADALKDVEGGWDHPDPHQSSISLSLGTKQFSWGSWDKNVSSEIGICFDWVVDQYSAQIPVSSSPLAVSTVDVLDFLCKYVQSATFSEARCLREFISRMKGVLGDSLHRLEKETPSADSRHPDYVGILGRYVLLCVRLLLLARSVSDLSSLAFDLEDMLKKFASCCIKALVADGLENVRKLYDDLQYVSIRDLGIKSDAYAFEAWVIVLKALTKARIPRNSFMDVVNSVLLSPEVRNTQDARLMEKMWYSLFSLLPLSEFDEYGVVISDPQHDAAFDNWALPQQMLKRVFELYKSGRRQSPGFNDYCRSIVSRCHYLIVEWGWWKCSGVIGTLFDFFASQNLAHLRNEEVYESPHFLGQLHLSPSLSVEPEDRCFHIFLKIVALRLKSLGEVNNNKGARNLVARLLPNHDRQYPREEDLEPHDLASLRNHHDLLCTLFWSAPPQHRPSVGLLQALVDPSRSHTAAIKINMRAYKSLARFVLSTPAAAGIQALSSWQRSLFDKLWQEFEMAEANLRNEAAARPSTPDMEDRILRRTAEYRCEYMSLINILLKAVRDTMNDDVREDMPLNYLTYQVYNDFLSRLLSLEAATNCRVLTVVEIIESYAHIIQESRVSGHSEDSQEELDAALGKFEATSTLANTMLNALKRNLEAAIKDDPSRLTSDHLVQCWVKLIRLVVEEGLKEHDIVQFVHPGRFAVGGKLGSQDDLSEGQREFWAVFLMELLECPSAFQPFLKQLDFDSQWLRLLALPPTKSQQQAATKFSMHLHEQSYFLLQHPFDPKGVALPLDSLNIVHMDRFKSLSSQATLTCALSSMKLIASQEGPGVRGCPYAKTDAQNLFRNQLSDMLSIMKNSLEGMSPGSDEHTNYENFVRRAVSDIKRYCSKFFEVPDFFKRASHFYRPNPNDPHMFVDTAIYHTGNLVTGETGGKESTLFHFLLYSLNEALAQGQLRRHTSHLNEALQEPKFLEFVVTELSLPILEIAMASDTTCGWPAIFAYFPQLAEVLSASIMGELTINGFVRNVHFAQVAFLHAVGLLNMVIYTLQGRGGEFLRGSLEGLEPHKDLVIAVILSFWYTLRPAMTTHVENGDYIAKIAKDSLKKINEYFEDLVNFPENLVPEGGNELYRKDFTSSGLKSLRRSCHEGFKHSMRQNIKETWTLSKNGNRLSYKINGQKYLIRHVDIKEVVASEEGSRATRVLGGARQLMKGMVAFEDVPREVSRAAKVLTFKKMGKAWRGYENGEEGGQMIDMH